MRTLKQYLIDRGRGLTDGLDSEQAMLFAITSQHDHRRLKLPDLIQIPLTRMIPAEPLRGVEIGFALNR